MNCDRIARWYRWMEYATFGAGLHRRRCHYLEQLGAERVLLLGDGDGRFLAEYASRYPEAKVDSLDASAGMLRLARERTPASERIRFFQADLLRDPIPDRGYDLVISHFFLDCFTAGEIGTVVGKVSAAAAPDARWVVSEFHLPPSGWRKLRAQLWIGGLYLAFRLLTGLRARVLPDWAAALGEQGFRHISREVTRAGLLTSELWERRPGTL